MKLWRNHPYSDSALLDAREHALDLVGMVDRINGGLDGDSLPKGGVVLPATALQAFAIWRDLEMDPSIIPAYTGSESLGTTYDYVGGGGWHEQEIGSFTCKDGWLSAEFTATAWRYKEWADEARRWSRWELRMDGRTLVRSGNLFAPVWTVHLSAASPVPSGSHTFSVAWEASPPNGDETSTDRMFHWSGGSLLLLNRYR